MRIIYSLIVLFLSFSVSAQIWIDDFNGSNSFPFTVDNECGVGSLDNWFGVICGPGDGCPVEIGAPPTFIYGNATLPFLSAYNTDGGDCGPNGEDEEFAAWTGIDISSCSSSNKLYLCFDVAWAAFLGGTQGWDPPSLVEFTYSIDGAPVSNLVNIEDQGSDTAPAFDLDCDGLGDTGTIDADFATFCFEIPGQGSLIDLTINFDGLNESNEDIAIDNVSLWCEPDETTLPAAVLLACGACGADNDCDGVISIDDCDDNDPAITTNSAPPVASAMNINVCEGDDIELEETFFSTGTWNWVGPDGTMYSGQQPAPFAATMDDNGTFTVTYTAANGCMNTDNIDITVTANEDASFSFADFCEGSTNGPTGIVTSGGTFSFNPAPGDGATIDNSTGVISNGNGGTTYSVNYTTSGTCPGMSTINVTVETPPNAGINGTLTVCQGTTPTDAELFTALLGSPQTGGSWSNVGLTYTYTINSAGLCPNATADVVVTEETPPNAGMNGTLTVCQGTTPTDAELFAALLGTPQSGGTWTNVGLTYTYTLNSAGLCPNATSDVVVTEEMPPNAGMDSNLMVCQGDTPTDMELFDALMGFPEPGGSWSNVGNTYTYTITSAGVCPDETAMVTVSEDTPPNSGMNGTLTVCLGTTPTDAELFAALLGTPEVGGTWSNVGLVYTYTTTSLGSCPDDMADVVITEETAPNAGMNGTLTVCQGTTPSDAELFAALLGTPQAGGSWSNVGLTYTYTVTSSGLCPNATADVVVSEETAPDAGMNGTLTVCQGTTPTNAELFAALLGTPQAGGSWSNAGLTYTYTVTSAGLCPNASADVVVTEETAPNAGMNGTLTVCQGTTPTDAELFAALLGTPQAGGSWSNVGLTYTYTVTSSGLCPNATADVVVSEETPPNAGLDGLLTICQGDTPTDLELFNALNGTPESGGAWSNVGQIYTYTVSSGGVCPDATAIINVTTDPLIDVGFTGLDDTYCVNESINLPIIGDGSISGMWLDETGTPTTTVNTSAETSSLTYTFIPDANQGCFNDTDFTFIVEACDCANPPSVTILGDNLICEGETVDLTAIVTNASFEAWSTIGDGTFSTTNTNVTIYTPGITDITNGSVQLIAETDDPDGLNSCMPDIDVFLLTISPLPNAGSISAPTSICIDDTNIYNAISDGDNNGTWSSDDTGVVNLSGSGIIAVVGVGTATITYTVLSGDCTPAMATHFIEIKESLEVSFTNLPTSDVCEESEVPDVSTLPQPNDVGVTGSWSSTDNGDNTYTYSFAINNQPADGCFVTIQPFTIEVSGEVEISFTGLPTDDVCDQSELPDVNNLPQPDQAGVIGTWSSVDNGDDTYTYSFAINSQPPDACFISIPDFTIEISGAVEISFANLPMDDVCSFDDLPEGASLPQPDQAGVTGTWTINDNGDNTYTYSFVIDNQPADACFVSIQAFTIEVLGNIEIGFTNLPSLEVCEVSDLPSLASLPQPDEAGVTGTWSTVDNGDDTYTYSFAIDSQPADGCFVSSEAFTIEVLGNIEISFSNLPSEDVCDEVDLPNVSSLPQPNEAGVTGTWSTFDNGDGTLTYSFIIDNQPTDACFVSSETFTIEVSGEIEISFSGLPNEDVCDEADLPNVNSLSQPNETGVTGTWSTLDNGDGTHTYSFIIDNQPADACFVTIQPFIIAISDEVEISFSGLPTQNVCNVMDLPDVASLTQPNQVGVTGTWSSVDNGDGTHTYSFVIDNQPADACFVTIQPFTIEVSGEVEVSFTGLPTDNVCDESELPNVISLSQPDQAGVTGTWSSVDNGDGTHTYSFAIDNQPANSCFVSNQTFTLEVSGNIEITFTNLATNDVCDIMDLPNPASLAQPDQAGVTGTWSSVDNGDGTHTYSFVIDNQPTDACFMTIQPFTIEVSGEIEISFSDLPMDDVCNENDLPTAANLAQPDQAGVTGIWSSVDNGDGTHTYSFVIDDQPADACFISIAPFNIAISDEVEISFSGLPTDQVCNESDLPNVNSLSQPEQAGVTGTWSSVDNGDGTHTYSFVIDNQPADACFVTIQPFTVEVSGEVEISFSGLPTQDVCNVMDLPNVTSLAQPDQAGVTGTWSSVDNGNGTHAYSFVIDNQPADACFVSNTSFTIEVLGSIEVSFTDLPTTNVCDENDLPDPFDLPQPDQIEVTGTWNFINNGDDTYTYDFVIDNQPADGCFESNTSFTLTLETLEQETFVDLELFYCLEDNIELPVTGDGGISGIWEDEAGNIVESINTNVVDNDLTYIFIPTPGQGCWENSSLTFIIEDCNCSIQTELIEVNCGEINPDENPTNDFIEFILNANIPAGIGIYSIESNVGIVTPSIGNYGEEITFSLLPGTAGNGNITITIIDETGLACEVDIEIEDPGSCSAEAPSVYIPTAFTPNDDGLNDQFLIGTEEPVLINSMKFYDRWGNKMWDESDFMSDDNTRIWNGTFNGQTVNPGVYVYLIELTMPSGEVKNLRGEVTILR